MKIGLTGYPFVKLPGIDDKKTISRVQNPVMTGTETLSFSSVPDEAVIRYLQAIDAITSELLAIVDDYAATDGTVPVPLRATDVEGQPADFPEIAVYFPPSGQTGNEEQKPGRLIVMKAGAPLEGGTDLPGATADLPAIPAEEIILAIAKDAARALSSLRYSPGLPADVPDTVETKDKFIIVADLNNDASVIVRQDVFGHREMIEPDTITDNTLSDIIGKISAILKSPEKNIAGEEKADGSVVKESRDFAPDTHSVQIECIEEKNRKAMTSATTPSAILKNIISFVRSGYTKAFDSQAPENEAKAAGHIPGSFSLIMSEGLPGAVPIEVNVTGASDAGPITASVVRIDMSGRPAPDPNIIISRMIDRLDTLGRSLQDLPLIEEDLDELSGNEREGLECIPVAIKENTAELLKRSVQMAATRAPVQYPGAGSASFGLTVNEDGHLRIDKAILSESLSARKDETVAFIRDFGNTLQERIRYDFNPLAGVYVGSERTDGIIEAAKKQGAAGWEDDKERTALEKRLNEVQMLLKSSYELKDRLLTVTSEDHMENLDEADR